MTAARGTGLLWVFVALLTAAQSLFKIAAHDSAAVVSLVADPALWAALVFYGVATLLWIRVLQLVPLSRAYLVAALTYVFVPAVGFLALGEALTPGYGIGSLLVIAGIVTMSRA